jgi:hypothetical protein
VSEPSRTVWVELDASERIVVRGSERVTWWVHTDGQWQPVRNHPGVELDVRSPGPQVVWHTRARLQLIPGTWLVRLCRSPHPQPVRDPMHYLGRDALRAQTKLSRSYFRVGRRGELLKPGVNQVPPEPPDELRQSEEP